MPEVFDLLAPVVELLRGSSAVGDFHRLAPPVIGATNPCPDRSKGVGDHAGAVARVGWISGPGCITRAGAVDDCRHLLEHLRIVKDAIHHPLVAVMEPIFDSAEYSRSQQVAVTAPQSGHRVQ